MTHKMPGTKPLVGGIERPLFLRQTLSLGALTLLTGCDISDHDQVQAILRAMLRWNDRAQAFLFRRQGLAPTYAESAIVHDFRYHAYFPASQAPQLSAADYMATALHPQTIMAVKFADEIPPVKFGYPFKVRIPTKLGFKNPKWVTTIFVTDRFAGGFWEDRGYNWFSGS